MIFLINKYRPKNVQYCYNSFKKSGVNLIPAESYLAKNCGLFEIPS